jgi:hypothetical protein
MMALNNTKIFYTFQIHAHGWPKARLNRFRKHELQMICESEGISSEGTVKELKERLMAGNTCRIQIAGEERLCDLIYVMCSLWKYDDAHWFVLESESIGNYNGMPTTDDHEPHINEGKGNTPLNGIGIGKGQVYEMEYNLLSPTKITITVLNIENLPANHIPPKNFNGKWNGDKTVQARVLEDCDTPMRSTYAPYHVLIKGIDC